MLYPKNSRYHSTYHEPLFFEPSKDIADSQTQTYFHWYKGDRSSNSSSASQDKNFYPSRWPRITNNERNYSHDVFKFGNCAPLHETKNSIDHIASVKDNERFSSLHPENYIRQQEKLKKENELKHINNIKLSREKRERERWNQILKNDKEYNEKLAEKRIHSKNNKPGKGFNIINNQYMNDASGRELALIDSFEKEKVNYIALKKYERINSYNPVKGIDIIKRLPTVRAKLDKIDTSKQSQNYTVRNENSAASVEPVYRLNINNEMNADIQLERLLLSSNTELQKRKEKVSEFQKKKK